MEKNEIRYEAPLTQFLLDKASGIKMPISGTFEVSPICNFACRMCYVRKTRQEVAAHPRPMMELEDWLKIAREAREAGLLYLLLTGGEPFLWPRFWELYEALAKMGFLISLNTNGSLIDEAAVKRLREHPPVRVNITLYGASDAAYESLCQVKGVFSRVDQAIEKLRQAGILVKLNCSVTPQNAEDLEAMNRYAQERGLILEANTYMFPPLRRAPDMIGVNQRFTPEEAAAYHLKNYRIQNGPERYRLFLQNVKDRTAPPPGLDAQCVDPLDGKIRCRAGRAAFWVTWDGWLTPCGMMPDPKIDLRDVPFRRAWQLITEKTEKVKLSGVCAQCPDQKMCHSCAAMAMAETGSSAGIPQYLCAMVQAMKALAERELAELGR